MNRFLLLKNYKLANTSSELLVNISTIRSILYRNDMSPPRIELATSDRYKYTLIKTDETREEFDKYYSTLLKTIEVVDISATKK